MPTGKLKKFVSDKGFGFITPDEGGEDIFAHTLQFVGDGDTLRGGERVTYEAEWDDRKGKYRASTWTVDASGAGAAMLPGVLKKYFTDKGFGFIEPQDGSEDLFAHQRQFSGDPNSIQDGMKVKYEVEWDGKKGKNKAGPDLGVLTMVSAAAAAAMAVVAAVAAAAMACSSQIMANPWVAAHRLFGGKLHFREL
ncbi:unnamed protein product [Durusdinium trenchii]|uniref:CSD domain-containing protein n=1 Tax=Durusdinium trenchii TaxID=1381693 RepID=A0ABP0QBF1_9DINO